MSDSKDRHDTVHPRTAVLTRGFDPMLSVGSARPAVFRSSTYVFSSPEAAERAFNVASGRAARRAGERPGTDLLAPQSPERRDPRGPDRAARAGRQGAVVFNSGMAAIMTAILAFVRPGQSLVYTVPLYGGTQNLMHELLEPFGIQCIAVPAGHSEELDEAIASAGNLSLVLIETPANPTMMMTDIRRAAHTPPDVRSGPS